MFGDRADARSEQKRDEKRRKVERLFDAHQQWVNDAITIGGAPFIQVIAALVREGGER